MVNAKTVAAMTAGAIHMFFVHMVFSVFRSYEAESCPTPLAESVLTDIPSSGDVYRAYADSRPPEMDIARPVTGH